MKILGIEGTITEFKELASYIGINVAIIGLVLFILWSCRKNILKLLQCIYHLFKKKESHKKIKCIGCEKKKFSPTHRNISASYIGTFGLGDHRQTGDFLICNNCREVVGIWRGDNSLDQYKITDQSSWNSLLHKHKVCFSAYKMHAQWIKDIDYTDMVFLIEQLATFEMQVNKINLVEIKRFIAQKEALTSFQS